MERRNFLTKVCSGIAGLTGLSLLPKAQGSDPRIFWATKEVKCAYESEFGLGKYVRHYAELPDIEMYNLDDAIYNPQHPWGRYIQFPIVGELTIEYEKGIEKYTGFNPHKNLVKWLNTCHIGEIMFQEIKDGQQKTESDKWGIKTFRFPNGEKCVDFKLASVSKPLKYGPLTT